MDNNVFADILIKGGQLVKKDRIEVFKKYVLEPYADLNDFVDVEIGLALMEANQVNKIDEGSLERILEDVMRRTFDREVWRTQILDQILEYTEGMIYNLGEQELSAFLHKYISEGKSNELYENLKPELESIRLK